MRILIVRVSALGDAIHTLPALDLLKKYLPTAQIDWLVQQKNFGIVKHIPGINHVYVLSDHYLQPKNLLKTFMLLKILRNNRYDLVIDFQGLCKTSLICAALDLPSIGFNWSTAREELSSMVHHRVVAVPADTNIIEKNKALVRAVVLRVPRPLDKLEARDERDIDFLRMSGNSEQGPLKNVTNSVVIPAEAGTQSPFTSNSHSNKKNTPPENTYCSSSEQQDEKSNLKIGLGPRLRKDDDVENKVSFKIVIPASEPGPSPLPSSPLRSAPQPSPSAQHSITTWLHAHNARRLIILTPNTTWNSKHWPLSHWQELAAKMPTLPNHTVVCVGQKFGRQGAQLASFIEQHKLPIIITPSWSLDELFAVMRATDIIIAPDTGLLHIADSIGVATIGLYGPTLVQRHGPQITPGNKELCFQAICRHVYEKTHVDSDCMETITADAVVKRITTVCCNPIFNDG